MRTVASRPAKLRTAALAVILLVAFALRTTQLDRQPLWWDEGLNAHLAHQSLPGLLSEMQTTRHADPPLYPLVLGGWRALIGSSPFALRLFSAALGVLAVALTWVVGCWLTGKKPALLAALLVALAPMLVYYTREAKSYPLAAACALLSTYAWGRKLECDSVGPPVRKTGWWIVYALSTAAAVGSHYYLGLLVLWQGLWTLGSAGLALTRKNATRREALTYLGRWLLAAAIIAALLAPWILALFGTTVKGVVGVSRGEPLSLWGYLGQVASTFSTGEEEGSTVLLASCGLVTLGTIGVLAASRRTFLLTWVVVPLAAAYPVQAAFSFFHPRFLLYLGPVCYLLVSQGIVTLWLHARQILAQRLSVATLIVLIGVVIGLWIPNLAHVYTRPVDEAEDPRPAIAHIRTKSQPDDALVYIYIWQAGYLSSYCPHNELTLYRAYYTPQAAASELESIFASHPRLWLLSYRVAAENTIQNLSATWLEGEAYKVESNWYGNHHLALYLAPGFQTEGVGPEEKVVSFNEQIELRYPLINARLSPGDVMALPLHWRALTAIDEDYQVFVHLGLPDIPPLAQNDGPPQNGLNPTSTWAVGQEVLDRRALLLPDTLPPGRYLATAGLYRLLDGSRLPPSGTGNLDFLTLGYVEVEH